MPAFGALYTIADCLKPFNKMSQETVSTLKQPLAPRLPKLTSLPGDEVALHDYDEFAGLLLDRPDFTDQQAAHITCTGVHCKHGGWSNSRLYGARCQDTRFEGCDLANATWEQLIAHRVEFVACQLLGWNAPEAHLQNVRFQTCNAQFAGLRFASFKQVRFEQCDLRHADFQRADLSGVVFHKCDLSHAQLSGAILKGTDFRSSTIDELKVGIQELPGAIVDHMQAAYIAGLLGIVIKDEYE